MGKDRHKTIVFVRHAIFYLLRRHTKMSFPEIGRLIGNRDHTTAMSGTHRMTHMMTCDPDLKTSINELSQRISSFIGSRQSFDEEKGQEDLELGA